MIMHTWLDQVKSRFSQFSLFLTKHLYLLAISSVILIGDFVALTRPLLVDAVSIIKVSFDQCALSIVQFLLKHTVIVLLILAFIISIGLITFFYSVFLRIHALVSIFYYRVTLFTKKQKGVLSLEVIRLIYRYYRRTFKRRVSFLIYAVLDFLWENLRGVPVFADPYVISRFFHTVIHKILQYLNPFIIMVHDLLIDKPVYELEEFDDIELMDHAKQIEEHDNVPQKVLDEIRKDVDISEALISDSHKSLLNMVINRWNEGNYASLLISGEQGGGKSTLCKYIRGSYPGHRIRYIPLSRQHPIITNDYIRGLADIAIDDLSKHEKEIIILDDLELTFLKEINGFSQLKKLIILIERTKSRILWIVTINKYAAFYLNKFFNLNSIFQFGIDTNDYDVGHLPRLYSAKLNRMHYNYRVIPSREFLNEMKRNLRNKVLARHEIDSFLKERFFKKLDSDHLLNYYYFNFYYVKAVIKVKKNTLLLSIPDTVGSDYFSKLNLPYLFILHALLMHKRLNKEDLLHIIRQSSEFTSVALSIMIENNIIRKSGDEFEINPPIYFELVRFLQTKNILQV